MGETCILRQKIRYFNRDKLFKISSDEERGELTFEGMGLGAVSDQTDYPEAGR